ncbi:hypothetical protein WJ47_23050 [Burkholderia ubonensis]|uniref:Cytochrome C oxidase assembly protein n=1 Tax=Burkholderia ubonensis TaxID=101571 RepID=A0A105FQ05_9BURK|nr:hypothetical protein WJ35_12855 [Burkholderia ubonensis]AOK24584.1 hypothetical protein WK67_18650 [Burkholderia ubonensis]AOK60243.1 hypothetical protein WM29_14575 [Burkholderia ubonensis]KVC75765.1 hypothetical protein WI75_20055 [Burkholderia ubonensis]KVD19663.1 hypothetical protein WI82_26655 [Burkholderia ubonensis]
MPAAAGGRGGTFYSRFQMNRNPQQRRTPEQIRAGNKRLGLILLAIAAVFFVGVVIKQWWLSTH